MLENELRDMFGARVSKQLSALDPASVAIQRGRRVARMRRAMLGMTAFVAFAAMLGGAAMIKGMMTPAPLPADTALTYDGRYGSDLERPYRAGVSLPVVTVPVDVYVGTALWTSDGRKFTLSGVDQVIEVIRVPAGWLYSDDIRLRLLTLAGSIVPVRENISSWAVSADGERLATVADGTLLETRHASGELLASTTVPQSVKPVSFMGDRVVIRHATYGFDDWNSTGPGYRTAWRPELLGVFPAINQGPVGLVRDGDLTCLADMAGNGLTVGGRLGCGDLLETAARSADTRAEATRSPTGQYLAIPSATGVHVIDIDESRKAKTHAEPFVAFTCPSAPDAPAVWVNSGTLLTISKEGGILACRTDGGRHAVPLPAGVSEGWALVPRFGV